MSAKQLRSIAKRETIKLLFGNNKAFKNKTSIQKVLAINHSHSQRKIIVKFWVIAVLIIVLVMTNILIRVTISLVIVMTIESSIYVRD